MRFKGKRISSGGFTFIELMLVVAIIGILGSILFPQVEQILVKATQAKAKSNLGVTRSAISLYYSRNEGLIPFAGGMGSPYTNGTRQSLTSILVPEYVSRIFPPVIKDGLSTFNELNGHWDGAIMQWMSQDPPLDIWIQDGPALYTPLLNAPFIYDNMDGKIYIPNGNYDSTGNYFYNW